MFQIDIFDSLYLKNAVEALSSLGDEAMLFFNEQELCIQVRGQQGNGPLTAALRLRSTDCSYYHFLNRETFGLVGISLATLQGILNQATHQEFISISFHLDENGRKSVAVFLKRPGIMTIYYPLEVTPYNAPWVNVKESHYRVTASIPSEQFCNALIQLRCSSGPDDTLVDTLEPVEVHITSRIVDCQVLGNHIIFEQENGEFNIQGATDDDQFDLTFALTGLQLFLKVACKSERVFIHAEQGQQPLLNCPYGREFCNLFLIGY